MSKRSFYHFTPPKGWMNDPNGLIKIGDTYHIFYQHYPLDTKWGPMHWGHAISKDLLHFTHLDIALYPTEDEYIFSGSAVLDTENVSGLAKDDKPVLLLFYTAHNPVTGEQMQSMAYSHDYIHFEKYAENPLIRNEVADANYKKDFRDPKVFRNQVIGGFSMVLAAGDHIEIYHSENLLGWNQTGSFYPGEYGYAGICECPDLICFNFKNKDIYVMTMSMIYTKALAEQESHVMQYFIGEFDGNTFSISQDFDEHMLLDYGEDNYAMVSFSETEKVTLMGWGEDWNKARQNQATDYFGKLTLARTAKLTEKEGKLYLAQTPIGWEAEESNPENSKDSQTVEYCLAEGEEIFIKNLPIVNFGNELKIGDLKIRRPERGDCHICVYEDHGFVELFADYGLISYSQNLDE